MHFSKEDRGAEVENIISRLSSLSAEQKALISKHLLDELRKDVFSSRISNHSDSSVSSLDELIRLYPNVDFAGFISRDDDKEQYQLRKIMDAFAEVMSSIGRNNFDKLRLTLIVFGDKITYVSDGSIAVNYERFSKADLVEQLIRMFRSQR